VSIRLLLACLLILPAYLYAQEATEAKPIEQEFAEVFGDKLSLTQLKFEYERELKIATIQHFYLNMVSSAILYNCDNAEKAESIMQSATEVRNFITSKTQTLITEKPKFKDVDKISAEEKDTIESNILVHLSGYWFGYKDASAYTVKLYPEICQRADKEADQLLAERAKPAG
jgi:hypothetical protein